MLRFCCLCSLLCAAILTPALGGPALKVEPEASDKREAVLEWSESLRTFSGDYRRTFINYDSRDPDVGVPKIMEITYRFDGDRKYLDAYSHDLKNHDRCAFLNGQFTQVLAMDTPPEATITSKHFVKHLDGEWAPTWPVEMISPPTMAFQQERVVAADTSLEDFFAQGHTLIVNRDGKNLLVHRNPDFGRIEIVLDPLDRIVELTYLSDWKKEELAPFYDGSPLDLHYPSIGWRYHDYENINGVWFPLHVEQIYYTGGPLLSEIMARRNAGELDPYAAEVEIATTVSFMEQGVSTIDYVRDSLRLNEALDDDLFHVEVQGDALELDTAGVVIVDEIPGSWWSRYWLLLIVVTVAAAALAAGVIYWIRMRAPLT